MNGESKKPPIHKMTSEEIEMMDKALGEQRTGSGIFVNNNDAKLVCMSVNFDPANDPGWENGEVVTIDILLASPYAAFGVVVSRDETDDGIWYGLMDVSVHPRSSK